MLKKLQQLGFNINKLLYKKIHNFLYGQHKFLITLFIFEKYYKHITS